MKLTKEGRCVYAEAGFWLDKSGSIHIAFTGDTSGKLAIKPDPAEPNGHATLYQRLAKLLHEAGAPSPALELRNSDEPASAVEQLA
jgi:hypothetical protein